MSQQPTNLAPQSQTPYPPPPDHPSVHVAGTNQQPAAQPSATQTVPSTQSGGSTDETYLSQFFGEAQLSIEREGSSKNPQTEEATYASLRGCEC